MSNADGKKRLAAAMDEARRVEKEIMKADRAKDDRQSDRFVRSVTGNKPA